VEAPSRLAVSFVALATVLAAPAAAVDPTGSFVEDTATDPPTASDRGPGPVPDSLVDCVDHPPIRVTENAGTQGFTLVENTPTYRPGSGVTSGLGTADFPYVIEDLCIDGSDDTWDTLGTSPDRGTGIHIQNTDAHVVIRDVLVVNQDGLGIRLLDADNVRVESSKVSQNGGDGVGIRDDSDGNAVVDSEVTNNGRHGVRAVESGDDNEILGNTITDNEGDGIRLRVSSNRNTVANNTVEANDNGLFLAAANNNLIRDNTVTANAAEGLVMFKSVANEVHDNEITQNAEGTSLTFAHRNDLHDNTLTGNDGTAFTLKRSNDNTLEANAVEENRRGFVISQDSDDVLLAGNTIADNEVSGLDATNLGENLGTLDARNNWWGAPSAPSGGVSDACTGAVADGSGDAIRTTDASVCFDPWLSSPNPAAGAG